MHYKIEMEAFGDLNAGIRRASVLIEASRTFGDEAHSYLRKMVTAKTPMSDVAHRWAEGAGELASAAEDVLTQLRASIDRIEAAHGSAPDLVRDWPDRQ